MLDGKSGLSLVDAVVHSSSSLVTRASQTRLDDQQHGGKLTGGQYCYIVRILTLHYLHVAVFVAIFGSP